LSFSAVVLAGGKGTRLRPFTHVLPKPLLPIDERPILDVVLTRLAESGCTKATIAVGYLGHLIELYCGNGDRWSLELDYFHEETPLGTVGALGLITTLEDGGPFIVMNGDVLSDISFSELIESHNKSGAELTIASFQRTVRDELGIIEAGDDDRLIAYHEKPEHEYLVSMGIYVVNPSARELIPAGDRLDFPDLVQAMLERDRPVHIHRHAGYWMDLGRPDDYTRANEEFGTIRTQLGV
jgi:NDP-sugar pyrophosphorylase family protein